MANFGQFKKLDISKDKEVEYVIYQVVNDDGTSPKLKIAPALESNSPYFNALLKRMNKTARQLKGGVSLSLIKEARDYDRELYPRLIVKGWEHVQDVDGNEVEFTVENCAEFIEALPDWIFEDIRNFSGNPANFSETFDVEEVAGN